MGTVPLIPTTAKERHVVIDALRGLALLTYGNYFKIRKIKNTSAFANPWGTAKAERGRIYCMAMPLRA